MKYSEALEKLKTMEGGTDLVEAVTGELSRKNNEASGLRDRMKGFEGQLADIATKLDTQPEAVVQKVETDQFTLASLKQEMTDMSQKFELAEKEKTAAIEREQATSLRNDIKTVVGKKVSSSYVDMVVQDLASKKGYGRTEDGKIVNKDGTSLKDDLKGYLDGKEGILINPVKPGADTSSASRVPHKKSDKPETNSERLERIRQKLKK